MNSFFKGFEKQAVGARIYEDMKDYLGRKNPGLVKDFKSADHLGDEGKTKAYRKRFSPHYEGMMKEMRTRHGKDKPRGFVRKAFGMKAEKYDTKNKTDWYREAMPKFALS